MKIGTFSCWLFGHKFIWKGRLPEDQRGLAFGISIVTIRVLNYCVRCGLKESEGE